MHAQAQGLTEQWQRLADRVKGLRVHTLPAAQLGQLIARVVIQRFFCASRSAFEELKIDLLAGELGGGVEQV